MQHTAIRIILVLGMMIAGFVQAEELPHGERILAFDSVIEVQENASLTVTETITVVARQVRIKRGIYRELHSDIDFEVLEVLRDGVEEPYRIEDNRIYIGEGPPFLTPGKYTYTLRYQVENHLLFSEDADELQWDVTGRWPFLIDRITARVVVPPDAELHLLDSGDNRQDHWYQRSKSFPALNETFAIPSNRWWQENSDQARAGIYNDKYVIKFYENSGYKTYFATQPTAFCEACELSAETEKISGDEGWGYGLRLGGNKENSIRFLISGKGNYAILKGLENSVFQNQARKWAFSPHIHTGNQENHLKIEQREGNLSFWANGELLESVKIPSAFRNERAGFVVHSNGQSATEIRFDNLRYAKTEEVQASDSAAEESPLFFEITAPTFANTSFQIFVKWAPGYVKRGWRGWLASVDHHWQDWWASVELPNWWPDFGFLENWLPDTSPPKLPTFDRQTNALILAGVASSVAAFYSLVWLFWLRDPPRGLPRSRTTPPDGISPAAAHYLANKGYDDLTLVCALVSLASKGFLSIQCLGRKTSHSAAYLWAVSKQDDASDKRLSADEKAVSERLFNYESTVTLSQDNREHLKKVSSEHLEQLQAELDESHVQYHFRLFLLAMALYLVVISGAVWWLHGGGMSAEFFGPLVFGFVGMELLFNGVSKLTSRSKIHVGEVIVTLIFLAFSGVALFLVWKFLSPEVLVFMLVLRLLNRWFCGKIQPYTVEGRKVMDQLEGFREHLLQKQPKAVPSFSGTRVRRSASEWLPYTIALGIEKKWKDAADNLPSTPDWLEGVDLTDPLSPNPFIANFGATLSVAVAAATLTPSSGHGGMHGGGGGH